MKKPSALEVMFSKLPVDEQFRVLRHLTSLHEAQRDKLIAHHKQELARLGSGRAMAEELRRMGPVKSRVKPAPLYRSKKDKSLQWSGRGSLPRWMREEMKAGKLKPEAFLIAKSK